MEQFKIVVSTLATALMLTGMATAAQLDLLEPGAEDPAGTNGKSIEVLEANTSEAPPVRSETGQNKETGDVGTADRDISLLDQAKLVAAAVSATRESTEGSNTDATDTTQDGSGEANNTHSNGKYPQVTVGGSIEIRYCVFGNM